MLLVIIAKGHFHWSCKELLSDTQRHNSATCTVVYIYIYIYTYIHIHTEKQFPTELASKIFLATSSTPEFN